MKLVFISDVHCRHNKVVIPECDILISCGDFSFLGEPHEVRNFHKWMEKQDARYYISVMGNHEKGVEKNFFLSKAIAKEECPTVHFIDEGLVEIEGLKIYCSAITPFFHNWAWNRYRGEEIKRHWDKIPLDTDILVTHGPPYGIMDEVKRRNSILGEEEIEHVGCKDLSDKIKELTKLKVHAYGHIHASYGQMKIDGVEYINASICNEEYKATNLPIMIEL